MAAKALTTDARPLLPAEIVENVRARRVFKKATAGLIGYVTTGGTYILATAAHWSDDNRARDLIAVLPGDLGNGRVVPLYIGTNPDVVAYLEAQLADD